MILIDAFRSSLLRLHAVPSGVRCVTDRVLGYLIV